MYIYIYVYIYIHTHIHIYIYTYIALRVKSLLHARVNHSVILQRLRRTLIFHLVFIKNAKSGD